MSTIWCVSTKTRTSLIFATLTYRGLTSYNILLMQWSRTFRGSIVNLAVSERFLLILKRFEAPYCVFRTIDPPISTTVLMASHPKSYQSNSVTCKSPGEAKREMCLPPNSTFGRLISAARLLELRCSTQ